jgi:hypothetical protein
VDPIYSTSSNTALSSTHLDDPNEGTRSTSTSSPRSTTT